MLTLAGAGASTDVAGLIDLNNPEKPLPPPVVAGGVSAGLIRYPRLPPDG